MTQHELSQVVARVMTDPKIEACVACQLHSNEQVEQHRSDGGKVRTDWCEHGGFWRCTVTVPSSEIPTAAQVDLHDGGAFCASTFVPCKIVVSQEENFLCVSL